MTHDQVLDEILVGPVPVGVNKFVLQADAPDSSCIPNGDIIGVTVVLVTCSYKEREFVRVGYYVNNEYAEEYDPEVGPPTPIDLNKVVRTILADKPRVTRFPISWDGKDEVNQQQQHGVAEEESPMEEGGGDDFIVGDSINGIADGDLEEDEDADDLVGMEEEDMNE
jgi:histone chaperone ASF1